jgi:hypothetical protein
MAEYISKHEAYTMMKDLEAAYIYPPVKEAYATAARRIDQIRPADVQPVNQWISVDDRLPGSEKEVLVWYKYTWDAGFTSYGFGINVWYSNAKQWRDGCLLKGVEVLYWQPLPEPPKDGDNNG